MKPVNYTRALLILCALITGVAVGTYKNHQNANHSLSLVVPEGVKVSVYKDLGGDGPFNYSGGQAIASYSKSQTIKLKDGTYDFVVDNSSNQYENTISKQLIDATKNQVVIQPSYTAAKLAELLPSEKPAAVAALNSAYPLLSQNYSVTNDSLYILGDWYGAVLRPNDPGLDVVKIIEHKQGGSWKLATPKPLISIGEPANPTIPASIIEQIDNIQ